MSECDSLCVFGHADARMALKGGAAARLGSLAGPGMPAGRPAMIYANVNGALLSQPFVGVAKRQVCSPTPFSLARPRLPRPQTQP